MKEIISESEKKEEQMKLRRSQVDKRVIQKEGHKKKENKGSYSEDRKRMGIQNDKDKEYET